MGFSNGGGWLRVVFFRELNAALDFADRGEILVDFAMIGRAKLAGQAASIIENIIENAGFIALALPAVGGFSSIARIAARRLRADLLPAASGVVGVRHDSVLLYAQLYPESQLPTRRPSSRANSSEGSLRGGADVAGGDLIHGNSRADAGAIGFLGMHTG